MEVFNSIKKPSVNCISSFEEYCGVKFPSDYIDFLQYGNGGVPKRKTIPGAEGERIIDRFLPLMDNPELDEVNGKYDISIVEAQIGERLADDPDLVGCRIIPFAALFTGDFLCFDYRYDKDNPVIVVWDHEQSDEFSPHVEFITTSFTELTKIIS